MRVPAGPFLLALTLTACQPAPPHYPFTTAFWFWRGSATAQAPTHPVDLLYVHAGTVAREQFRHPATDALQSLWHIQPAVITGLPPARQYWLVYRFEIRTPYPAALPALLQSFNQQAQDSLSQGHPISGLQLDIDCPTAALPQYAAFLRQLRQSLPRDYQLSITALLDWFRPGTAIAELLAEVDEFVPQFYDADAAREPGARIAEPLNAAHWAPLFNRFGKRFRIGLSCFGRARYIAKDGQPGLTAFYRDIVPGDLATQSSFHLETATNPAGETQLTYRAVTRPSVNFGNLESGDAVQFTLPNPAMIQAAVANAKLLGGHLAGVIFFRWPTPDPNLAMHPTEVLRAAGAAPSDPPPINRIEARAGSCATVNCADLYWFGATTFDPQPIRARIQSSTPLEYFMPDRNVPARLTAPTELRLHLPPYFTTTPVYLGRAVSTRPATFTLHEEH
jgi:hypothetical protein